MELLLLDPVLLRVAILTLGDPTLRTFWDGFRRTKPAAGGKFFEGLRIFYGIREFKPVAKAFLSGTRSV